MPPKSPELPDYPYDLEHIIDQIGIERFLEAVQLICYSKEQHIRENWQDDTLANRWSKIAGNLNEAIAVC